MKHFGHAEQVPFDMDSSNWTTISDHIAKALLHRQMAAHAANVARWKTVPMRRIGQTPTRNIVSQRQDFERTPTAGILEPTQMADTTLNQCSSVLNVLIVDDSNALQQRLASMLRNVEGLKVVGQAVGVADAHKAIEQLQPDLVVLDLQLGDGSGIEVLRETKKNSPKIKFVIFTNQSELQYRQRCSSLGAEYFLCKSTGARSLIAISESLVAREGKLNDCPRKSESKTTPPNQR